jgi:hypothetical protein
MLTYSLCANSHYATLYARPATTQDQEDKAVTTPAQYRQPPTRPQPRPARPSPVGDLISKHREAMREVYARHHRELQHPRQHGRAA